MRDSILVPQLFVDDVFELQSITKTSCVFQKDIEATFIDVRGVSYRDVWRDQYIV